MKKIISLILAMAMCLSLCVQTFAKENDGVNVENVPEMMGILRTDDGKEYTIKGVLVSVAPMSRAANDACSATYRYDLPVSPQANGSTTESDHDGAAASTVYLTISCCRGDWRKGQNECHCKEETQQSFPCDMTHKQYLLIIR